MKKEEEVKQSDRDFLSFWSQITDCPDDRREEEEELTRVPTGYEN